MTSLILGIISILFAIFCWVFLASIFGIVFAAVGLITGMLALVFGAKSKEEPMGIAGLVLGTIGGVVSLICFVVALYYAIAVY